MKRRIMLAVAMLAIVMAAGLAACGKGYKITVDAADDFMVQSCPKRAEAGETVVVETCVVSDGDVHVSVNGSADFGSFTSAGVYEFVMPEGDVTVHVWVTSNGLA